VRCGCSTRLLGEQRVGVFAAIPMVSLDALGSPPPSIARWLDSVPPPETAQRPKAHRKARKGRANRCQLGFLRTLLFRLCDHLVQGGLELGPELEALLEILLCLGVLPLNESGHAP
jgi:hypothetical protein